MTRLEWIWRILQPPPCAPSGAEPKCHLNCRSSFSYRRANHLQHATNAIVPGATAFNERRALNRLPIVARVAWLGLRDVREARIVLPVVAAHFVNHQVE